MSRTSGINSFKKLAFKERNESSKCVISKELRKTFFFPGWTHASNIGLRSAGKPDGAENSFGALGTMPSAALGLRIVGLLVISTLFNIYCRTVTRVLY